jgi:hypothetical protein
MGPAIRELWWSYQEASPAAPPFRRVFELAALRLLEAAFEHAQAMHAPSAHLVMLLQLADNMLREPHATALRTVGLGE